MGIVWDRRVRHVGRPVKPTRLDNVRGRMRKSAIKAQRGLPSRDLPGNLVIKGITLRAQLLRGSPQAAEALAQLEQLILRYRLAEGRRAVRDAAGRRRQPRVEETILNLWRRRRDWLLEVESSDERRTGGGSEPAEQQGLARGTGR